MPESLTIEYKKSFGKEAIISLVAFANTGTDLDAGFSEFNPS